MTSNSLSWKPDGRQHTVAPKKAVVLAASFNPLHRGHAGLLAAAQDITGRPGCYELSIENVDKPRLSEPETAKQVVAVRRTGAGNGHECPDVRGKVQVGARIGLRDRRRHRGNGCSWTGITTAKDRSPNRPGQTFRLLRVH